MSFIYSHVCSPLAQDHVIDVDYRIARKFGGELNLAVWQSVFAAAKLKSASISYLYICVWQFLTKLPNLNPPIFLQWQFWPQPLILVPANISGYTVCTYKQQERNAYLHSIAWSRELNVRGLPLRKLCIDASDSTAVPERNLLTKATYR